MRQVFAVGTITKDARTIRVAEGYARLLDDLAAPNTPKPLHEEVALIVAAIQRQNADVQQARKRAWNARLYGGLAA